MVIALNKPYRMLSQYNANPDRIGQRLLGALLPALPAHYKPLGRLDYDSEGLLLFSKDPSYEHLLLSPERQHSRRYFVQIEGSPTPEALALLTSGNLTIRTKGKEHRCLPAKARLCTQPPDLWERDPPVSAATTTTTTWLEMTLIEGKNRQIRRMTAATGHPTLRLVRAAVGNLNLSSLELLSGAWRFLTPQEVAKLS